MVLQGHSAIFCNFHGNYSLIFHVNRSYIYDTIMDNESHVGNIQFWFFNMNYLRTKYATFWSKQNTIGHLVANN